MIDTVELLTNNNAIELKGYSTLAADTFQNMIPALVGMNSSELKTSCMTGREAILDGCPFIWERFKDVGYYTALMEDTARHSMFKEKSLGFRGSPTDYYAYPFIRQTEIFHGINRRHNMKSVLSCMGDKYYFQVLAKYVQDITTTLKAFKSFGFFWESSMTDTSINAPEKMDYEYYKLLTNMDLSGYMKDTIVIFMSDHGLDIGDIRITKQGRMEQRLPLFVILFPPSFQKQYSLAYNNFKKNEGRLTTPFDVHKTLLDLIDMTELTDERIEKRSKEFYSHNRGISLFLEIPRNRTCEMANIDKMWCACVDEEPLASSNPLLVKAVQFITNEINEMLKPYPQCLKLIVEEIVIAKELIPVYETTTDWRDIKLVMGMEPGGGIFETVLRYHSKEWTIVDSIKRLNCLGFQSLCVEEPVVKLLCYCKGQN
ncbi:hypothetical protein PYW08_000850 [Mythimna loreyi]|uniref:Uncharacterized protein n=1 Tax=Mythimna loreyi TaxID=667449 RepID=A0ACC2QZZ4_9NEOP|nr:hypothetical protein PYW08_000850 [Mythimna loreyi]